MAVKTFNLNMQGYWREINKAGIPDFSGVFFVYESQYDADRDTVSLKRLLYVGEGENIKVKIATHPNYNRWKSLLNINNEMCFSVCYVEDTNRIQVMTAFIYKFRPIGNNGYINNFPFDETNILIEGKTNMLMENNFMVRQ
jgi:hypothetical protein